MFVGVADPWKPFPGEERCSTIARVEIVPLDLTDSESVNELAAQIGARVDILINTADHVRAGGMLDGKGLTVAREEMDIRYFGLMRLAQAFGPALRTRGADGVNAAAAFVNILSVYALANWPAYGIVSRRRSRLPVARRNAARRIAARRRQVIDVFSGPLETEWYQTLPPPKVAPAALAEAVVRRACATASKTSSSAMSRRTFARGSRSIRRRWNASLANE